MSTDHDILHLGLIDDEAIALDASALEIAQLDQPEADLTPYVETLTRITERLADVGNDAHGNVGRARVLAQVLGQEYGFRGDRETYDDPANADLIRVMDRRRGLPVSLAILYVAAARRLGWAAHALNTPGHVLAAIGDDTAPILIDPFNGGAIVSPEKLAALLAQYGVGPAPTTEHVAPMTNRATLVRLLLNQAQRAEAAGDRTRARTLFERMTTIAPAHGHGWWERARLELAHGDVSAARGSLSAMLEMTRDPALRTHIAAALDSLAGSEG